MKTIRKSLLKRTVALLLTICSLLAVMIPAVSAEGAESSNVELEKLTGAVVGEFSFGPFSYGTVSEVNGHDMLFLPHHKSLYVYDLDTWQKVDEEYLGMGTGYGCFVDSNGIVWAHGTNNKMLRYDPVTGKGTWTSEMAAEVSSHIVSVTEVNGKLYLGTYSMPKLVEYDPATDTFTDLGALSADSNAKRVGALQYKDGFIYATVHSTKAGKDPHILVKYDLANKKIVETLDLNETDLEYFSDTWIRVSAIVGNVLFIASNNQTKMLAIDISESKMRIMDPTEMGLPENSQGIHNGISEVIVEPDGNEKIYFMLRQKRESVKEPVNYGWSGWSYIYEYNSSTGKATPVESFPHSANSKEDWVLDYIHTSRGCLVTVDRPEIEGWTGPSIFTVQKFGEISLYNIASGKVWKDTTLTNGDGSGKNVLCITRGPEGTNKLYIGCYMSNLLSEYDLATGEMKRYTAYSEQIPQVYFDQDGKCYATGYGAASLCEVVLETGEVKVLFALNSGDNKVRFTQERVHQVTSGDGKIFVSTASGKGLLGGYLAWYDFVEKTTYVAVEKDKVIYQKDSDKTAWYDAKTNEMVVFTHTNGAERNFEGLIADQIPKAVVYQDGYVYGGTGISGGSGATPKEGESAVLFAYDVANRKLVTFDLRTAIEGLPEIVNNIRSVAADPDVPGKFWGQVAGTLFSFTYDKEAETFNVKEELSFSKSDCYYHLNAWTAAPPTLGTVLSLPI